MEDSIIRKRNLLILSFLVIVLVLHPRMPQSKLLCRLIQNAQKSSGMILFVHKLFFLDAIEYFTSCMQCSRPL